jgi:hypothetical protein
LCSSVNFILSKHQFRVSSEKNKKNPELFIYLDERWNCSKFQRVVSPTGEQVQPGVDEQLLDALDAGRTDVSKAETAP